MRDLGTLGGPDALASYVNEHGQVAGFSYTNSTPNIGVQCPGAVTSDLPTIHPFLWDSGTMLDLGTLGGNCGGPAALNNRGQVIGSSTLPGDLISRPFLWDHGVITDLGTLGGDNGEALAINDAGEVVGDTDLPGDEVQHAFLWRNGAMTDLGTLGGSSSALYINSTLPSHAARIDLNSLIPSNSSLELVAAENINDRGEIVGVGVPGHCFVDFCGHVFLLIPCGRNDSTCAENAEGTTAVTKNDLAHIQQPDNIDSNSSKAQRDVPFVACPAQPAISHSHCKGGGRRLCRFNHGIMISQTLLRWREAFPAAMPASSTVRKTRVPE